MQAKGGGINLLPDGEMDNSPYADSEIFHLRITCAMDLDPATIAAWEALEGRALEKNAYLSPNFVIPAIKHFRMERETVIVLVEREQHGENKELAGAGVFRRRRGTARFPLPHLQAFLCPHSYLTGLLVEADEAPAIVRLFFEYFCASDTGIHGVEFSNRSGKGPLDDLLTSTAQEYGAEWHEYSRSRRAVFVPAEGGDSYLNSNLPRRRVKELNRMNRRLSEKGELGWRLVRGEDITRDYIDRFIELEHMGWKGERGTSLFSRPENESFFREMIERFKKSGSAFFTGLSLNGVDIACTSNLISGSAGFAFKIGWHPQYARMAPGLLNEVELIRHAHVACKDLDFIDSGATEGSFIEQIWTGRRWLTSGIYGTTPIGKKVLSGIGRMRRIHRKLKNRSKDEHENGVLISSDLDISERDR